ncbi:MAG: hypothetical protein ABN490_09560, partial [Pantoea agglomerans]
MTRQQHGAVGLLCVARAIKIRHNVWILKKANHTRKRNRSMLKIYNTLSRQKEEFKPIHAGK